MRPHRLQHPSADLTAVIATPESELAPRLPARGHAHSAATDDPE
ncbi:MULTISPECIES: hypothetical protein [unclassified Streptomyces]